MACQQVLEGRYIDPTRLKMVLDRLFGARGNYFVRLQLNCWILTVPRKLTEVRLRHSQFSPPKPPG
ncbi:hypothetical protein HYFRA_00007125 [Hymenoscyphus fraxineus]|uniref:Uncharacterized protein n=1 Tax=Hymenoscyphus fraxineus TaxID=746836 RepID=A0A9N9KZS7_9HELO|nr:hypothetical protein HYFRA_00007125 [Hymenoscyphus fraxineus]